MKPSLTDADIPRDICLTAKNIHPNGPDVASFEKGMRIELPAKTKPKPKPRPKPRPY